jgi:hypothetical protein
MMIRSIALSAMAVTFSLCAAELSVAPLAIYYSFDTPPAASLVAEMESEVGRILAVGGVRVVWRDVASPRKGEDFPGVVVLRFRGVCSFGEDRGVIQPEEQPAGQPLAETDVAAGRVLPFGSVDCDRLRGFIAPVVRSLGQEDKNARLGRAMARVGAHEIYHMLTGSEEHARRGIARAKHSREQLTAPTFAFAREETNWLRDWVAANRRDQRVVAAVEVGIGPDEAEPAAPAAASPAGR